MAAIKGKGFKMLNIRRDAYIRVMQSTIKFRVYQVNQHYVEICVNDAGAKRLAKWGVCV